MMWAALAACALVMLSAMTWLTRGVLASERQRQEAEARADQQERVRLALWRMDALGASTLLNYNQQTAETFRKADPFACSVNNAVLQFDLTDRNRLTIRGGLQDGEKPQQELRKLLADHPKGESDFKTLEALLPAVAASLWAAPPLLPNESVPNDAVPNESAQQFKASDERGAAKSKDGKPVQQRATKGEAKEPSKEQGLSYNNMPVQSDGYQQEALSKEAQYRQKAVADNWNSTQQINRANALNDPDVMLNTGDAEPFHALWLGERLLLLRRVQWQPTRTDLNRSIQGVWLDSDGLRAKLLEEVKDLLPNASLMPAGKTSEDALTLASLPWTLQAGRIELAPLSNAVAGSLWLGWLTAIAAIAVAAVLVRGVMRLSERRASFVSAVTHELRTPLTTFRLYSDMLESGVVKEERRGEYFRTLRREADRLAHLVENVLAFSRIERGSARTEVHETAVGTLLENMRERFESRLASAGLSLRMAVPADMAALRLKVDAAGVEHILFNLIDNAAKYANGGADKQVLLSASRRGSWWAFCVRDHGPGISASERRKIFRPFHKSAQAAAESQPGVGLGLALSQRLARQLGGRLTHEVPTGGGSVFCLELPTA